jgi:dTDP-4-dehydrorhamnose reductase
VFKAFGSDELDITESSELQNAMKKFSPDIVVNCAAWTDVDGAEGNEVLANKVNSAGAKNVAFNAKKQGAKLIHISTDYVFSGQGKTPWEVSDPIDPQNAYGRTKAEGEIQVLRTYPENSLIVRTAWLYSPWGRNFAKAIVNRALNDEGEVRVVCDQVGQPTSARDLAKQIIKLGLTNSTTGVYHGTNAGEATWFEFAREIFTLAGADLKRVSPISSLEYPRSATRPTYSVLSHDGWMNTLLPPMRDWRIALSDEMPAIIEAVCTEG